MSVTNYLANGYCNGRARRVPHVDPGPEDYPGDHLLPLPGVATAGGPEPYQPFPTHALPPPLGEFVRQGALALGCDQAYLALPVLAVAASAIGNTRVIQLKRTWTEPSVIWAAIVGDSGTLKSPAWMLAVAPLFTFQGRLLEAYRREEAMYQAALERFKEAKRTGVLDASATPPQKPILERVICSDTTVEKLASILEDNPRGILLARDELSGWLGSFTRYKGRQGGTDLPNWLEMHRAGAVMVDRKTSEKPTLHVPRAAVSVTGGIQPGILARALTADFLDAGLGARLLMAWPPKLPKKWSDLEIDQDTERGYHELLGQLLALDLDSRQDERVPHALTLSPEAKSAWTAFYDDWAEEQAAAEGELAAAFSKLEAYAARFALVHHVVSELAAGEDDRGPIQLASVQAGIILCRWFGAEARRIYASLSEPAEDRARRRLVEFVHVRGGRLTGRQLQRSNPAKYPDVDQAEAALQELVDTGVAEWQRHQPQGGGRPSRLCVLLPHPTTDNTRQNSPDADGAGDLDGWGQPDKTPTPIPPTPGFSGENEVLSGIVSRRVDTPGVRNEDQPGESSASGGREFRQANGVSSAGLQPPAPPSGAEIHGYGYDGQRCPLEECVTWDWEGAPQRYPRCRWPIPKASQGGDQ